MANENPLYLGVERIKELSDRYKQPFLNIKHPATITSFDLSYSPSYFTQDKKIELWGINIKYSEGTGRPLLIGSYQSDIYKCEVRKSVRQMVEFLAHQVYYANERKKKTKIQQALAFYGEENMLMIVRMLLEKEGYQEKDLREFSKNFGIRQGKFDANTRSWTIPPIYETTVEIEGNLYQFGIKKSIKSSLELFIYNAVYNYPITMFAYDIKGLYAGELEDVAKGDPENGIAPLLSWFHEPMETHYQVNLDRFNQDREYTKEVLGSSKNRARAAKELGELMQDFLFTAFGNYPKHLFSSGSLTSYAMFNTLTKEEFQSVNFYRQLQDWKANGMSDEVCRKLEVFAFGSYAAGQIENYKLGYTKEAHYNDINSAFPFQQSNLLDLRGSILLEGEGKPPFGSEGRRYIFCDVIVNIPYDAIHSLSVKDPNKKQDNIYPVDGIRCMKLLEEIEFAMEDGAQVQWLSWVAIETEGTLSPITKFPNRMFPLREEMKKQYGKGRVELAIKMANSAGYGKLYEMVPQFVPNDKEGFDFIGWRAGRLMNVVYASVITAFTRITLLSAYRELRKNKATVLLLQTDGIFWIGDDSAFPKTFKIPVFEKNGWESLAVNGTTEAKTMGMFSKTETIYDFISLGSGRYQFTDQNGKKTVKSRGIAIEDANIQESEDFDWLQALNGSISSVKNEYGKLVPCIKIKQLVIHGVNAIKKGENIEDFGKFVKEEVDLMVTRTMPKRDSGHFKLEWLKDSLIDTYPVSALTFGRDTIIDGILHPLNNSLSGPVCEEPVVRVRKKKERKSKPDPEKNRKNSENWNQKVKELGEQLGLGAKEARKIGVKKLLELLYSSPPN